MVCIISGVFREDTVKQFSAFVDITGWDYDDDDVWFDMAGILFCTFLDHLSHFVCQPSTISLLVYSCTVLFVQYQ